MNNIASTVYAALWRLFVGFHPKRPSPAGFSCPLPSENTGARGRGPAMAVRTLSCVQRASEEEAPAYERQHRTSPESTPDASGPLRSGPQWSLRWDCNGPA